MRVAVNTKSLVTFSIAGQWFGLHTSDVEEVVVAPAVTEVPLAPERLWGLINLRGQILPAFRGAVVLGLTSDGGAGSVSLILRLKSGLVGLQVDRAGEVLEVDAAICEPAPGNLPPALKKCLKGICRTEDLLLLELDSSTLEPARVGEANRN